ncbi:MAG: energy transducer TonB, partial [Oligoflexia bacterium]|nr:energy transducer TonB [Oligoflexia bacterium]
AYTNQDREGTPIFRIQPLYPRRAALQNIEGFVILQFDITAGGYTDNITVIQASPPQIFNSSAVQALRKWKYKPKIENGKPVRQKNLKVQLDFNLRDQ